MMRRIVVVTGMLLLAFPALPAEAGGFCQNGDPTEGAGAIVRMAKACYFPTVLRTEPGTEVRFVNDDTEPHTVTAAAGAWGDPHREVQPEGTMHVAFDEPGVYPYTCLIHPGMTGTVLVGDVTKPGTGGTVIEVEEPATTLPQVPEAEEVMEQVEDTAARVPSATATTAMALGAALPALTAGYVLGRRRRRL